MGFKETWQAFTEFFSGPVPDEKIMPATPEPEVKSSFTQTKETAVSASAKTEEASSASQDQESHDNVIRDMVTGTSWFPPQI